MAFCTKCGNRLVSDAKFCSTCGQAVVRYDAPNTAPVVREILNEQQTPSVASSPSSSPASQTPMMTMEQPVFETPVYAAQTYVKPIYSAPVQENQTETQPIQSPPQQVNDTIPDQPQEQPVQQNNTALNQQNFDASVPQQNNGANPQQPYQGYNGYQQPNYQQTGYQQRPYQQQPYQQPYAYQSEEQDIAENKGFCVLSYLGILLLIPLLSKPNSAYVRYHSNQGLVLLIFSIIMSILTFVPYIGIIGMFAYIFELVCIIMGIVNTVNGQKKPLPLIGGITLLK